MAGGPVGPVRHWTRVNQSDIIEVFHTCTRAYYKMTVTDRRKLLTEKKNIYNAETQRPPRHNFVAFSHVLQLRPAQT